MQERFRERGVADPGDRSVPIGPAGSLLRLHADAEGTVAYRLGTYAPRRLPLGKGFEGATLAAIDTIRAVWFFDPNSDRLRAVAHYQTGPARIFFFGPNWGWVVDETGARRRAEDPYDVAARMHFPLKFDPRAKELAIDFNINVHLREAFVPDARRSFREGTLDHRIELTFLMPAGEFDLARLLISDRRAGGGGWTLGLRRFPFSWPEVSMDQEDGAAPEPATPGPDPEPRRAERPPGTARPAGPSPESTAPPPPPRASPVPAPEQGPARARLRRPGAASPEASRARTEEEISRQVEATLALPAQALAEAIEAESDEGVRRRILEANLDLGQAGRSYPLLLRYHETIAEITPGWDAERIARVFGMMPGSVLLLVAERWSVNQVLAAMEGNPEREKIQTWLRERELDRMLDLTIGRAPGDPDEARRDLGLDERADGAAVKRAWRTLLQFLHADLGRNEERAIHRKKDEIAKRLQAARDLLLKG